MKHYRCNYQKNLFADEVAKKHERENKKAITDFMGNDLGKRR
jgi:hypothetical protein